MGAWDTVALLRAERIRSPLVFLIPATRFDLEIFLNDLFHLYRLMGLGPTHEHSAQIYTVSSSFKLREQSEKQNNLSKNRFMRYKEFFH